MPEPRDHGEPVTVFAPGRVNLIGEHTDYTGGLAIPMAIDLGTTVTGHRVAGQITLSSADLDGSLDLRLDADGASTTPVELIEPAWGRYVAAVASTLRTGSGFAGRITTTIPIGTGLSSSAALEVATALALGTTRPPVDLALACRDAELLASGVPCGVMDQLTSIAGVADHALLIDFRTLANEPVPMPPDVSVVIVDSGQPRQLATTAYGQRRAELEAAERLIGPLRDAGLDDVASIDDPTIRSRARHVVTENARVRQFADALRDGDVQQAGSIMIDGHVSFRDDFAASTTAIDQLVDRLVAHPGVHGARLTGGGFGGCVVALVDPRTATDGFGRHWRVRASEGARSLPA